LTEIWCVFLQIKKKKKVKVVLVGFKIKDGGSFDLKGGKMRNAVLNIPQMMELMVM